MKKNKCDICKRLYEYELQEEPYPNDPANPEKVCDYCFDEIIEEVEEWMDAMDYACENGCCRCCGCSCDDYDLWDDD